MIVDDKDLHRKDRSQVAAGSLDAECTSVPGRKHEADLWRMSSGQYFRMIQRDGTNAHNRPLNVPAHAPVSWPRRTTMAEPSKSEYIRWVQGSLNRLLGASLADDGKALLEYRSWLITFQMKHKLAVNAKVDLATQNALIKANRKHAGYVRWIQNALLISGEGIKVGGKNIVADGSWGAHTEQAVKAFQSKHEKTKADGWVGAKTERFLMLRTATIPPGRTKALREPTFDPVIPIWDVPVPDDPIPELRGVGYRFDTSEGVNIAASIYGLSAGTIYLEEMEKRTKIGLSYAALGLGASPVPAAVDLSTMEMDCIGGIYPNLIHGNEVVTLNDITGWCLIYQGVFVSGVRPGGYLTVMFLSMGAGLVSGFAASMTGIGTLVAPVLMARSCKAIVAIAGFNTGSSNMGVSGAIGYLSLGNAKEKIEQLKRLVPA
jgi:peptidoglycan hydrolase-like protein with peptidoglycan-binding domain